MTTEYIAYPWSEYQEYMGEEWFREECYYCADKDVYFIPINRVNESENKEIRKDIISNLNRYINCIKDGYDTHSAKNFVVKEIEKQIAWLEKQDKSANIDIESMVSSYKQRLKSQVGIENSPFLNMCLTAFRRGIENTLEELNLNKLEKQGEQETLCDKCRKAQPSQSCQDITELGRCYVEHEQKSDNSYCQENCKGFQETGKCFADGDCKAKREAKSTNKVEPKFKVDDWISNDMCDVHIASIENGMYYFDEGDGLSIVFVDEHYHIWTIEDAMDGDVLQLGFVTAIFQKRISNNCKCYCSVCDGEFEIPSQDGNDNIYGCYSATPANKEQRDTLFAKMKEAGYIWIFSKKELIKVEQNPTKWSEEDERNIQNIDSVLFYDKKLPEDTCVKLRNFLKTLKQRCI